MDFEEWMDGIEANDYDDIICAMGDAFKAGQQSKQEEIDKRLSDYQLEVSQVGQSCVKWKEIAEGKQAEIDALKMTNHNLSVQVIDANAYAEHWQKISNKSQAEIDKIKQLLKQWDDWISVSDGNNHIDIVKECADELRELLK